MGIDYTKRPASDDAQAGAVPVSLSKVTLTKAAPTVSLSKHGGQRGMLHVNLNWDAKPPESKIAVPGNKSDKPIAPGATEH